MSDGTALAILVAVLWVFLTLGGIRKHLKRIADVCERADKRSGPQ